MLRWEGVASGESPKTANRLGGVGGHLSLWEERLWEKQACWVLLCWKVEPHSGHCALTTWPWSGL